MSKFDVWLRWSPTLQCNLHCMYCSNKYRSNLAKEINISALINVLDSVGSTFVVDFLGGGEPLLIPNIVETFVGLTKKHYVAFFTNLTSKKIPQICEQIDPQRVKRINVSMHLEELNRTKMFDIFVANLQLLKEKKFQVSLSIVAYPGFNKEFLDRYDRQSIDLVTPFMGRVS